MKANRSSSFNRLVRVLLLAAILSSLFVGIAQAASKGPHPTKDDGYVGRSGKVDPDHDGNCGGAGDCNHRKVKVTEAPATEVPIAKGTPEPGDPPAVVNTPVPNDPPAVKEEPRDVIAPFASFAECLGYLEVAPQGRAAFRVPFRPEGEAALIHLSVGNAGLVVIRTVVDAPVKSYTVDAASVELLDRLPEYVYRPTPVRHEHQAEYDLVDGRRCLAGIEIQGK